MWGRIEMLEMEEVLQGALPLNIVESILTFHTCKMTLLLDFQMLVCVYVCVGSEIEWLLILRYLCFIIVLYFAQTKEA